MRSVRTGTVLLASCLLVVAACGRAASSSRSSTSPMPVFTDSAGAPHSAAYEADRYARATALRERILAATRFETPAKDTPCDPGSLRTSPDSGGGFAQVDSLVRELERTVVTMGIDQPIDTPMGHDLLRAVLAWEAGAERPRWDVPRGTTPPRAIPAGLTGEFFNEGTQRCEPLAAMDTVTLVIPPTPGFRAPRSLRTAATQVFHGDTGLARARDAFYASRAADTTAVFLYARVTAMVLWHDYAVAAVNRPADRQGVMQLQKGAGGATYLFHRVGEEWRLLAIVRTWG